LIAFIRERLLDVGFLFSNGMTLQKSNFGQHIKIFLRAYADPRVESYTRKVRVHNVLEMSRFLRILGRQTFQCTLSFEDTIVSFIFKTTKNTVEYIRIIQGKQDRTTIDFDVNLKLLSEPSPSNMIKSLFLLGSHDLSINRLWNTFKLFVAAGTEVLTWKLTRI